MVGLVLETLETNFSLDGDCHGGHVVDDEALELRMTLVRNMETGKCL